MENKINLFIFYPEVPLILSKDNAKIRLSERNGNLFTFPSVRILSKPSAIQNEKAKTFIFVAEVPLLSKPSGEYDFIDNEIFRTPVGEINLC